MAAIGAGVAMLGATITGAIAQDLADYPQPYVDENGVFNTATAIVVGAGAAASDTLGAVDIAQQLQFDAKTPVSSGDGTVTVAGGVTEDIPLGKAIANDTTIALDWQLQDTDIESFQDTEISFQSDKYNVHDELVIKPTTPTVQTSLTSSDDDYETNIFMEVESGAIQYYYAFDEAINVTKATSNDPLEIKFLGQTLKITGVSTTKTEFTATVGAEFFMDAGDTVTVDGKKITLVNVGEGGAIVVDVEGVLDTISSGNTKTINGIEVKNDETFYTNEKSERSASLVIGEDAVKTYEDEDAYVGEDESDPDWVWNFGRLGQKESTAITNATSDPMGPFLGIKNDFTKNDDTDDPAGIGECYDLPNNYASICLDSLTVAEDDYLTVTMEIADGVDTTKSKHVLGSTSAKTIHIYAPGSERFVLKGSTNAGIEGDWSQVNGTHVKNKKTSEIWLQSVNAGTNETLVFYKDSDANPSMVYGGNVSSGLNSTILQLNFGDTKETNALLSVFNFHDSLGLPLGDDEINLAWNFTGDSTSELSSGQDVIGTNWSMLSGVYDRLGSTASSEEAGELWWLVDTSAVANDWTDGITVLGTKDEDHRTPYGVIIKDPKSNGASDQVVLQIPGDQVQANIVVKGQTTSVSGGSTSFIPANIDITTRLDSELAGSEANYDLIIVGGPCANDAVEAVTALGVTCEGARAAWSPGEAVLKMASNGDKVALLVAGYNAMDTRVAARVLKNYADYDTELTGSEVKVTGGLSSPTVTSA